MALLVRRYGLWLAFALAVIVWAAACTPSLGSRPGLPTAVSGVSLKEGQLATPQAPGWTAASGPTSTPAPWATARPPTPTPGPVAVPHDIATMPNCVRCHSAPGDDWRMPADHSKRTNESCLGCHPPYPSAPNSAANKIPHTLDGREGCLICHLTGTNGARPVPGDHRGRLNDTCLKCHSAK